MSSVNKVIIIGNLGADPDVRATGSGQLVCTLSVATSDAWTDKQGERQERTEWHRVVLWGKLAELAQRFLGKGRKVYVEGRLQTRSWEDDAGQKRYSTEVVATQLVFLDSGKGGAEQRGPAEGGQQAGAGPGYFDGAVPF